jgi:hypothetical protein
MEGSWVTATAHEREADESRPRLCLAEPVPVVDALGEYIRELVDQAPELSPRIAERLARIIGEHKIGNLQ